MASRRDEAFQAFYDKLKAQGCDVHDRELMRCAWDAGRRYESDRIDALARRRASQEGWTMTRMSIRPAISRRAPVRHGVDVAKHNCYRLIDEALAPKGIRLSMCIEFSPTTGKTLATPRVMVEPNDDSRGAKKAAQTCNMLASNCPFCGVELERLD